MRICRFDDNRVGIVSGEGIRDVTAVLDRLPQVTYPLPRHDPFIAALRDLLPEMPAAARRASPIPVDQVKLLSPVANPGKIIAAPVNYKKHLEEALADKGIHHGSLVSEIHKAIRGPEERSLRKSPDSYCVLGPWLTTPDEIPDPGQLALSIKVNGETRQDAHTARRKASGRSGRAI